MISAKLARFLPSTHYVASVWLKTLNWVRLFLKPRKTQTCHSSDAETRRENQRHVALEAVVASHPLDSLVCGERFHVQRNTIELVIRCSPKRKVKQALYL